jgi:hypothetical protein
MLQRKKERFPDLTSLKETKNLSLRMNPKICKFCFVHMKLKGKRKTTAIQGIDRKGKRRREKGATYQIGICHPKKGGDWRTCLRPASEAVYKATSITLPPCD